MLSQRGSPFVTAGPRHTVHSNCMRFPLRSGVVAAAVVSLLGTTASGRPQPSEPDPPRSLETLAIQVLLDRMQFSPGEIDGTEGLNTLNAIDAFEHERGRRVSD